MHVVTPIACQGNVRIPYQVSCTPKISIMGTANSSQSQMGLQGVNASIEALVNDTVGTLCATRYTTGPDANIAVIMGTGTNACYVESVCNIPKYKSKYLPRTPDMVVSPSPSIHSFLVHFASSSFY